MPAALPRLYAHPFSSYSQKALIALYENRTPFDYRNLEDAQPNEELAALWPMRRFPVLVDGGRTVIEATSVIEYLDLHHPGPVKLIPADPDTALQVRMLDRFFDNYISTPQQSSCSTACAPKPSATRAASLMPRPCSIRRTRGWTSTWRGASGRRAGRSRWRTAARRRFCSTRTGRIASMRGSRMSGRTGRGCWHGLRSSGRWMRRDRIGRISRWGRRIGIEAGSGTPRETSGSLRMTSQRSPNDLSDIYRRPPQHLPETLRRSAGDLADIVGDLPEVSR